MHRLVWLCREYTSHRTMVMGRGESQMTAGSTKPETNRLDPMDVLHRRCKEDRRLRGLPYDLERSPHCIPAPATPADLAAKVMSSFADVNSAEIWVTRSGKPLARANRVAPASSGVNCSMPARICGSNGGRLRTQGQTPSSYNAEGVWIPYPPLNQVHSPLLPDKERRWQPAPSCRTG